MKKIAFITTNKILAQSLDAAISAMSNLKFEFFMLLDPNQALIDAEIFEIDIALIDVMDRGTKEKQTLLPFCELLHEKLPACKILLLVSQDDPTNRKIASRAKKDKIVDDFVFYDASLKYLFAKLSAF